MKLYTLNDEWLINEIEGDGVLYNEKQNVVVTLNESGYLILILLKNRSLTFDEILHEYKNVYVDDTELESDLQAALNQLTEIGVLTIQ